MSPRSACRTEPSVLAIDAVGLSTFREAPRETSELLHEYGIVIRLSSELGWITAEVDSR